jgi:hypothetical protein
MVVNLRTAIRAHRGTAIRGEVSVSQCCIPVVQVLELHKRARWGMSDRKPASPRSSSRNVGAKFLAPGSYAPLLSLQQIPALPPSIPLRPFRCGPIAPGLFDCHRGRNGAAR